MDPDRLGAVWGRGADGVEPYLVHEGVIVTGRPGIVVAFDTETGDELWTLDVADGGPRRVTVVDEVIHYDVGDSPLVIDLDLGEPIDDVAPIDDDDWELGAHWPQEHRVDDGGIVVDSAGWKIVTADGSLRLYAPGGRLHTCVLGRSAFAPTPALVDGQRIYAALTDGSLWCLSTADEGQAIEPGSRTRENPVAYLADALHLGSTNPLGLRARLSTVDAVAAEEAVVDWAVRSACASSFGAAGLDDAADELDDLATLVGWELLPDESNAIGEMLSAVWDDEDDLDRKAGEVAGVVWTLIASALAGAHAVESRAVLLVERSRVLAAHPIELSLEVYGGAYPYLTAGGSHDLDEHGLDLRRAALGLLAAAATARAVDLAPDADDVLNEIRAGAFDLLDSLVR